MLKSKSFFTYNKIKQKLMDYCMYQDRCHWEVLKKMNEFNLLSEEKDALLIYLIENDYLNEERFTRSYIRGKFYQKKWGKLKIYTQLHFKEIPEKLIEKCIDEIEQEDYMRIYNHLAKKKWNELKDINIFTRRKKILSFMQQKGYENELIYNFLNNNT